MKLFKEPILFKYARDLMERHDFYIQSSNMSLLFNHIRQDLQKLPKRVVITYCNDDSDEDVFNNIIYLEEKGCEIIMTNTSGEVFSCTISKMKRITGYAEGLNIKILDFKIDDNSLVEI